MKRIQLFIPLAIFIALAALLYFGLWRNPQELPSALIGKPLPEFSLPSIDDPARLLVKKDVVGKPFILNVWASWCPSCKEEHAFLVKLASAGIPIVGVNYKDAAEDAKAVLADLKNPYQFNIVDHDGSLGIDLGVYGAPESFVIDAQGIIRYKLVGVIDEKTWQSQIAHYFYEN